MESFAKLKSHGTSRRTRVVHNLILGRDVPMSHAKHLHKRRYVHDYLEIINREGLPVRLEHAVHLLLTQQPGVLGGGREVQQGPQPRLIST